MAYQDFFKIQNILDIPFKTKSFYNFYLSKKIYGLHYVDFIIGTNSISISKPDHSIHHESTCFLIEQRNSKSINSVSRKAHDLKKFLDFLLIWDIRLEEADLLILLTGFVHYLQLLNPYRAHRVSYEWALLRSIPLNDNKVIGLTKNTQGLIESKPINKFKIDTVVSTIDTAIQYLAYLKGRTIKYQGLNLNEVPSKYFSASTLLSGTLGKKKIKKFDIKAILGEAGINPKQINNEIKPLEEEVFTEGEINEFFNLIPQEDVINKCLFEFLRCFGLRRSEVSNLTILNTNIPKDFYLYDHWEASDYIKENLKGDVEYLETKGYWLCKVIWRDNQKFDKRLKSGNRYVPQLMIPQTHFTNILVSYLQHRQIVMESAGQNHNFLFISNSNNSKGKPIGGGTVYSKFNSIVSNRTELFKYSPHTFRHYFATYMIRVRKEIVSDVSDWLGHRNIKTTQSIYLHYLPNKNDKENISVIDNVISSFKENADLKEGLKDGMGKTRQ